MKNFKKKIFNIFACFITVHAVIFFLFLLLYSGKSLFGSSEMLTSIKDSFTITVAIASVMATLVAAYIALLLFHNWREESLYNLKKESIQNILKVFSVAKKDLRLIFDMLLDIKNIREHAIYKEKYLTLHLDKIADEITQLDYLFRILSTEQKHKHLFENFTEIENHFRHIDDFFINIQLKYTEYYELLESKLKNDNSDSLKYWNWRALNRPYKNIAFPMIDLKPVISSIIRFVEHPAEYRIKNGSQDSIYIYESLITMIVACINKIEAIECSLIKVINPNHQEHSKEHQLNE